MLTTAEVIIFGILFSAAGFMAAAFFNRGILKVMDDMQEDLKSIQKQIYESNTNQLTIAQQALDSAKLAHHRIDAIEHIDHKEVSL